MELNSTSGPQQGHSSPIGGHVEPVFGPLRPLVLNPAWHQAFALVGSFVPLFTSGVLSPNIALSAPGRFSNRDILEVGSPEQKSEVVGVKALGNHVIAELSHCHPGVLSDLEKVQEAMIRAAKEARATVREVAFHKFYPHGVSGVVVLSESHIAIHTWPEHGYAAIDVYTCGDHTDPRRACQYLAEAFGSKTMSTTVVERGVPTPFGSFNHVVAESHNDSLRLVSNAS